MTISLNRHYWDMSGANRDNRDNRDNCDNCEIMSSRQYSYNMDYILRLLEYIKVFHLNKNPFTYDIYPEAKGFRLRFCQQRRACDFNNILTIANLMATNGFFSRDYFTLALVKLDASHKGSVHWHLASLFWRVFKTHKNNNWLMIDWVTIAWQNQYRNVYNRKFRRLDLNQQRLCLEIIQTKERVDKKVSSHSDVMIKTPKVKKKIQKSAN
jgi:hypothetical protein